MVSYDDTRCVFTHPKYGEESKDVLFEDFKKIRYELVTAEVACALDKIKAAEINLKKAELSEVEFYETLRWGIKNYPTHPFTSHYDRMFPIVFLLGKHYSFDILCKAINSDKSLNSHRALFNASTIAGVMADNDPDYNTVRRFRMLGFNFANPEFVCAFVSKFFISVQEKTYEKAEKLFTLSFSSGFKPEHFLDTRLGNCGFGITYLVSVPEWMSVQRVACAKLHSSGKYEICCSCCCYLSCILAYNVYLTEVTLFQLLECCIP